MALCCQDSQTTTYGVIHLEDQKSAIFNKGQLIGLGFYPLLFEGRDTRVSGMVISISIKSKDYQLIINRLDGLEGFDHRRPEAGLYRRVERFVTLDDNSSIKTWIYLRNPVKVTSGTIIDSGDWQFILK